MTLSSLISRVEEGSESASASVRPEPSSREARASELQERIREFFVSNIGATRTECADALGVDRRTIWKHLKRIRGSYVHPIPAGLRECAEELADLVDAIVAGEYTPDSFTTQPIRAALSSLENSPAGLADAHKKDRP